MATTKKTSSKAKRVKAERIDDPVIKMARNTGWISVLESVLIGVLGGILIWRPEGVLKVIFYVVGICLMVKGVYRIVNYFAVHGKYDFYNNDLLYGIIALVFGVLCVVLWEQFSGVIGIVVGAWMIYGSLVRMNTAIKMHTAGVKDWFYVMLLALIMLALGIYMVVSVGAVLAIVGWVMIAAAVIGIIEDIVFIKNVDAIAK